METASEANKLFAPLEILFTEFRGKNWSEELFHWLFTEICWLFHPCLPLGFQAAYLKK